MEHFKESSSEIGVLSLKESISRKKKKKEVDDRWKSGGEKKKETANNAKEWYRTMILNHQFSRVEVVNCTALILEFMYKY